jgi:membrane protein required for colicin V production
MLVVLVFATFRGYIKGLAWQIASLASIVVSYIVAYRFRDQVASYIDVPDPWRGLIAMLALFVGSSVVIWFLFQSLKSGIEKAKLKDFDKQLGAIFGAVKGAALCTLITLFAVCLLEPGMTQQIVNSRSGGYIARALDRTKALIPTEIHDVLEPYIEKAEDRFQDRTVMDGKLVPMPSQDRIGRANQSLNNDVGWP